MKPPIAIIGGSGVKSIIKGEEKILGTPYGPTPTLTIGQVKGREAIYLPRHGEGHTAPPHKVNYRANIWGLKNLEIVIPSDLIDFTKSRRGTFYDNSPVTHIDVSEPYCPTLRNAIANAGSDNKKNLRNDIVMACTEGPRYETPAEIRMLKTLGGGIVGMTGAPEAFLAREQEICYASISFISNMAAGLQRTLSAKEVEEKGRETGQILNKILIEAIGKIPDGREGCSCGRALAQAQLNKPEVKEQTC